MGFTLGLGRGGPSESPWVGEAAYGRGGPGVWSGSGACLPPPCLGSVVGVLVPRMTPRISTTHPPGGTLSSHPVTCQVPGALGRNR